MTKGFVAIALALITFSVGAQTGPKIWGGTDCGTWIKEGGHYQDRGWLMGYLSGMNVAMAGLRTNSTAPYKDPLAELRSADQVFQWMTNHCTKEPLETVQGAANILFFELVQRRQAR